MSKLKEKVVYLLFGNQLDKECNDKMVKSELMKQKRSIWMESSFTDMVETRNKALKQSSKMKNCISEYVEILIKYNKKCLRLVSRLAKNYRATQKTNSYTN
jgi:hypothetical protein